jgi:hypothetical protein
VQDLRKGAGLELDETIELWLSGPAGVLAALQPHRARIADDTLASRLDTVSPPAGLASASVDLANGTLEIALRPAGGEPT